MRLVVLFLVLFRKLLLQLLRQPNSYDNNSNTNFPSYKYASKDRYIVISSIL